MEMLFHGLTDVLPKDSDVGVFGKALDQTFRARGSGAALRGTGPSEVGAEDRRAGDREETPPCSDSFWFCLSSWLWLS